MWITKILLTIALVIPSALSHGSLEIPTTRDVANRPVGEAWLRWMPILDNQSEEFVCRNIQPNSELIELNAGDEITMEYDLIADHVGPCFFYIGDEDKNEWYKFWEKEDCKELNFKSFQIKIPDEAPTCEGCVLRWEWYALHMRLAGIIEYYTNCIDINLFGNDKFRAKELIQIPGHLPSDIDEYWVPYDQSGNGPEPFYFTGPDIVEWEIKLPVPTPSPTPAPPSDDNQHCVAEWKQCGGVLYSGESECCEGLFCDRKNRWYSQCILKEEHGCVREWGQCGGDAYYGITECCSGLVCDRKNRWYSQCKRF